MDELPLDGSGVIHDVSPAGVTRSEVDPAALGLAVAPLGALAGGTAAENAAMLEAILGGVDRGPRRDVVLLNAAAAFVAAGRTPDLGEGVELAAATIDGGSATALLARLRAEKAAADGARAASAEVRRMSAAAAPTRPAAPARPASRRRAGVLAEIAARRAADVAAELGEATYRDLARAAAAAPAPRDATLRLARPGLHLIAEVKRSSPSAGAIDPIADPVARARAYEAGGASVISVLCEPHWFGGSVADLRAVRAAVAVPVLAKEFVVDPRQLPLLRAAGADLVLLLAVLHPARRLADLVARARDLGLEPLVEVHDERELPAALATGARLIGLNTRNLRTLEVDPDHPIRVRALIPDDRIVIAESGVRDPATVARWRAAGFDAALVGEALVRAADPRAAAAAFVAAGAVPDDVGAAHRIPLVKICGVVDDAGLDAALAAQADAIGLNLVPGTPRALDAGRRRRAGPPGSRRRRPRTPRSSRSPSARTTRCSRRWRRRRTSTRSSSPAASRRRASPPRRARPGRSSTSPRRPRPMPSA